MYVPLSMSVHNVDIRLKSINIDMDYVGLLQEIHLV